ncbi:peroxidase family protein [Acaryochloris marina]|uniref:Heme peroxidase n=1 Tax=Acaryochloris marina (strain MBIC 11017) TaxID=329726 RepID=A8ZLQ9_ACAM1|nr:peroxidase family protein [Acaryochloris marina]ABW32086.1 conserved hypothetical protein [Acaryochloris marina MBIC11017]BDM83106.1 hypothetical protein AM10699_59670 [Acaryochloris marina MBIC10699]
MNDPNSAGSKCPFGFGKNVQLNTQSPGLETGDPLEAMNAGNHAQAITLLNIKVADGSASQTDIERLALAKFESGDPKGAAKIFRELGERFPESNHASWWQDRARVTGQAAMNGESVERKSPITDTYRSGDANRVLREFWEGPNKDIMDFNEEPLKVYVPKPSLWRKGINLLLGGAFDLVQGLTSCIFKVVDTVFSRFGKYRQAMRHGIWTYLPSTIGLLRLASDRNELLAGRNIPESMKTQSDLSSSYTAKHPGPGGFFTDPDLPSAGAVGQPIPIHGGLGDKPNKYEHLLPSAAEIAQAELYATGRRETADHLNVFAIDHLFDLPHDVLMPAFNEHKKIPIPVASGSPEAELGIEWVWIRANEIDPKTGAVLSSTTNAWDGSPDRGSTPEAVKRMRTDPATGEMLPGGKIYLQDGKWLPNIEHESGAKTIQTGIDQNMSIGVTLIRTVYVRFHNLVCDILAKRHPELTDNQLYWKAANIVIQTRAKVHTAFWTPMLFGHETATRALHSNQFGLLQGRTPLRQKLVHDPLHKGTHPALHGLAGNPKIAQMFSDPELKGLDFSETYRPVGHALQPDGFDMALCDIHEQGKPVAGGEFISLTETLGSTGNELLQREGIGRIAHMLMNTSVGAFTLNNYLPEFAHLATAGGTTRIGETDVQRGLDRGTGRYNSFLERLNIPGLKSYRELFKEPDSKNAQEVIQRWEQLFGPYNEASGELFLTTGMGQLADEFRPEGYAVPNPTFMNFVMEASTRFMHNEWLTNYAGPEQVTPTGTNIVNAVTFEHLLGLFGGDEFREYLEGRERPNAFSNMRTNIPHPIESHVDYGEENLLDFGAGAAYLEAHWTGKGLENYEIYRVHDGDKSYLVDLTDRQVYMDHDNDGRIRMSDAVFFLPEGCPSENELFAKAEGFALDSQQPGKLSTQEIKMLKQHNYDKKKVGVAA